MATQPVQPAEAPANPPVRRKRRLVIANDNGKPTPPAAPIALPAILAFITGVPMAPRHAVEQLIEQAIEALDLLDGDPDIEPNGDELDGEGAEDEPHIYHISRALDRGAGCPISDPGGSAAPISVILPEYGDDETRGPTNYEYAERIRVAAEQAEFLRYERRFGRYDRKAA